MWNVFNFQVFGVLITFLKHFGHKIFNFQGSSSRHCDALKCGVFESWNLQSLFYRTRWTFFFHYPSEHGKVNFFAGWSIFSNFSFGARFWMKLVEPRRSWRGRTWTPASLVEQPRWSWRGSTWTPSSDVFWVSQACKGFACSTWRLLFLKGVNDRVAAGCVFVGGVSKRRSWIFFSLKTDSILLWAFYKMYIFWARENLRGKSQIDVFDESTQYFSSLFWMRSSLQHPTDIRRIF